MNKFIILLLVTFLVDACSKTKKSSSNAGAVATKISASLNKASLQLNSSIDGFEAKVSCTGDPTEITLTESSSSTTLFGDDISGCSVELISFSVNSQKTTIDPAIHSVTPSKSVSLAAYNPGDDISISFTVSEIQAGAPNVISSNFTTSNVNVSVTGTTSPDYTITKAEVIALDPLNLGLKISFECGQCDDVEVALGDFPGGDIDSTALNTIHTNTKTPVEGSSVTQAGSVSYKFSELGLSAADIPNIDMVFSLRRPSEQSYTYARIVYELTCTDNQVLYPAGCAVGVEEIVSLQRAYLFKNSSGGIVVSGRGNNSRNYEQVRSSLQSNTKDIKKVGSSTNVVAILFTDGTVTAFGSALNNVMTEANSLSSVEDIAVTSDGFSALIRPNGKNNCDEGCSLQKFGGSQPAAAITNAKYIWGSHYAKSTVVTHADDKLSYFPEVSGNRQEPLDPAQAYGVVDVHISYNEAFVGVRADGTAVVWGDSLHGGNLDDATGALTDIKEVTSGEYALYAIKNDKTIVAWEMTTISQMKLIVM